MRTKESVLIEMTKRHIDRTSPGKYQQENFHQPVGEFEMPMGFEQTKDFEILNDVTINVFGYDKGQFYPLRVSSFESEFVIDLLLLMQSYITMFSLLSL